MPSDPSTQSTPTGTVVGLYIYPVKGCRGVSLKRVRIGAGGPRGDRRYMVVDEGGGFLSQRTHPQLSQVNCALGPDDALTLSTATLPALTCPPPRPDAPLDACTVWRDEVLVQYVSEGSAWFSRFLSEPVRLAYLPEPQLRHVNPQRADPDDQLSLADSYPLLWTNQSSLDDLCSRLQHALPMDRFRPNLVTAGLAAFEEDTARELLVGGAPFRVPKLCDRCVVTTTDQLTGERAREPLRTLARYRRWKNAVWFGANLIPDQRLATNGFELALGDTLQVTASGAHPRDADA